MSSESKRRILWVDDEPSMLNVLQALLTQEGYEIKTTNNGLDALEIMERETFDLVGTNIRMMPMNGLEMSRIIRERFPDTVIIIASAAGVTEELIAIEKEVGIYAHIRKAFKVEPFLALVEEALSSSAGTFHGTLWDYDFFPSGLKPQSVTLELALEEATKNDRVCPQPQKWNELWKMLPERHRTGNGWEPAVPLILAAWWDTSIISKSLRLREHLEWAESHNALDKIMRYMKGLSEEDWYHGK